MNRMTQLVLSGVKLLFGYTGEPKQNMRLVESSRRSHEAYMYLRSEVQELTAVLKDQGHRK